MYPKCMCILLYVKNLFGVIVFHRPIVNFSGGLDIF